jgi:branched-chain amino acid transport system substrate-binding protein
VYLAKVKDADKVTTDWDYEDIVSTIPAADAFKPLSESTCKM